jgi:Phosphotransferase enzyme family
MSDHLSEEKVSVSPSSSLEQYDFDDKLYEAFIQSLERDLGITDRDDLGGGLSGARTSSVRLEGSGAHDKKGQYILKVCLSEKAEREIQMHQTAKASSILRRYVPELITSKSYNDLPLTGILYEVAGGSHLMRTTLQKSLELDHFPWDPIEALTRVMLRWNFAGSPISKSHDLLGTILKGVEKERLPALLERMKGIMDYPERPQLVLSKLGVVRYNPMHFLLSQEALAPLRQMSYVIPVGILHWDLHPGNVIIPVDDDTSRSFHVIDFAASRAGNAFYDLAYLELTILLNSFRGFHSIAELKSWWRLEQYLISTPLPRLEGFVDFPQGLRVLPIRRVLARRMKQDHSVDDYWVAFLAASVEAALDLARKIRRRSPQRAALLTAVSRFHYLVERLGAIEILRGGEEAHATMYWPGEEPPPPEREEKKVSASVLSVLPYVEERRTKLDLVWPGEINQCRALFDPWEIVEMVGGTLAGEHDQGVLLVGERKFGKSSFLNCLIDLIPKKQENLRAVRLDTLNIPHSAQSFSAELLGKMCESAGLPFDEIRRQFDREGFFPACQSLVNEKKDLRFVICVDEIDATLDKASPSEDGHAILHLLAQLLTDPSLPVRLLLTVTYKEILARYRGGTALLEDLQTWKIPVCISVAEVKELVDRFEVPVKFDDEAFDRIFYYSGGQVYFVKLAVRLAVNTIGVQADENERKKIINAQRVDKLLHELISPLSSSSNIIRDTNDMVFRTMNNIYSVFFSKEEQQFMQVLAEAKGVLRISSLQVGETQFQKIANELYQRGYISKVRTDENEEYSWRIGIWHLFLEEYHQLRYRKR